MIKVALGLHHLVSDETIDSQEMAERDAELGLVLPEPDRDIDLWEVDDGEY